MKRSQWKFTFLFTFTVFITLMITACAIGVICILLVRTKYIHLAHSLTILILLISSVIVGTICSRIVGGRTLKFVSDFSNATKEIARGNFDVRLSTNMPAAEFSDMAESFNYMADELSKNEMMKNDFIENVSHEYKTPLAAIEGYATLLQTPDLTAAQRQDYTARIIDSTKRMSNLVGNILLLSRLEHQEGQIEKTSFSLDEQIRETILLFEKEWVDRDIHLEIDLDDAICYGNQALLAEVWQNLLSNALKFVPDHGEIHISLTIVDGFLKVTISDNGIGMDEETMHHMYDKFFQADQSRTTAGNGLGLSLVRRIIAMHNGTIHVESEKGKGTRFIVSLPSYQLTND